MKSFVLCLVALLFFFVCFNLSIGLTADAAQSHQQNNAESSEDLWKQLLKLRQNKLLPEMTKKLSQLYLFSAPRKYSLVLFFTSNDQQCPACRLVEKPLRQVASHILEQPDNLVFIFKIDLSRNQEIFQELKMTSLPAILHIPPSDEGVSYGPEDLFPLSQSTIYPSNMVNWINQRANTRIYYAESWLITIWEPLGMFSAVIGIIFLVVLFIRDYKSPFLWFSLVLACYFFNQMGAIWNVIRKPQMLNVDPYSDKVSLINPSSSAQYIAEGIIVATINSLSALSVIILAGLIPSISKPWLQRTLFIIFFVVLLGGLYLFLQLFCIKHSYYPYCPKARLSFLV